MEDRLGNIEFEEVLMDLISPMILNRNYIATYKEFWDNLVFKLFENYYYSKIDLPPSHYAKIVDIFFGNLFEYPSSSEKLEDIIDLHVEN